MLESFLVLLFFHIIRRALLFIKILRKMAETQEPREPQQQRSSESETDDSLSTIFSENEHLLEKPGVSGVREPHKSWRWVWLCLTTANVAVLCLTILILISGRQFCHTRISYAEAYKDTQEYCTVLHYQIFENWANRFTAPVYKSFSPSPHKITANGTLFNYPPSVYLNDPSPEIDAEWNRISPNSWLLFTRAEIIQMEKDPGQSLSVTPQRLRLSI